MTAKISASADGTKVNIGNAAEDALQIDSVAKTINAVAPYILGDVPTFSAFKGFNPPASVFTVVTNYTGSAFQQGGLFDLVTGRFTVAKRGIYSFVTNAYNTSASQKATSIYKNGVSIAPLANQVGGGISGTVLLELLPGDYIQAALFQSTTDGITVVFQGNLVRYVS